MGIFHRITLILTNSLAVLSGIALTMMMLLGCANIVLRTVWIPVKGCYEMMGFLCALATAFGLAYTQKHKGHIALTLFAGKLSRRTEQLLDAGTSLLSAGFFILIAWRATAWAGRIKASGEVSGDLNIIYYPIVITMAFGILVLGLLLITEVLQMLFPEKSKENGS